MLTALSGLKTVTGHPRDHAISMQPLNCDSTVLHSQSGCCHNPVIKICCSSTTHLLSSRKEKGERHAALHCPVSVRVQAGQLSVHPGASGQPCQPLVSALPSGDVQQLQHCHRKAPGTAASQPSINNTHYACPCTNRQHSTKSHAIKSTSKASCMHMQQPPTPHPPTTKSSRHHHSIIEAPSLVMATIACHAHQQISKKFTTCTLYHDTFMQQSVPVAATHKLAAESSKIPATMPHKQKFST
ncbi:hypothetical protein COO60DRAFT_1562929 [Scenedesmus sp. NREL 46B-D3]|nr:hypothetical protein COO60DRAFT_1562929 [Scenedesmus sp. NREL 46B-D3]